MESKKAFIDACNNMDGVDFIKASSLYLSGISDKNELNEFVTIFGGVSKIKTIEESVDLKSLCVLLRDKVYDILIANGDVPENSYIYLYNYYSVCSLSEDLKYTAYEQFVDQHVLSRDISDMERMYLVVLRFFAAMVNSRKDAFDRFLSMSMRLHMLEIGSTGFSKYVSDFINDSKIEFEEVLHILSSLFDKEFYFTLPKTERRSVFNWSLHSLWLVQKYFNHPDWVSLYPKWKAILYEHIGRNECDEAMYVQFFIYHKMGNSFQTQEEWKNFNEEIDKPASEYYKKWQEDAALPKCKAKQSDGKKIIGFLQDRFVMNSPFKVQYSLWKALVDNEHFRENYEIRIYLMSYFEKSLNDGKCIQMVENLGIDVFDGSVPFYNAGVYHNHLEKALYIRDKILSDGVDILVTTNNGYDISDFLVVGRVAPKQIYWSHGNYVYDIEGIDERVTHCAFDKTYNFKYFLVPTDVNKFYNPPIPKEIIDFERAKYPKDATILGVIGRLVKLDSDEYLQTVAKIMNQNPNTIFIAAGAGSIDTIRAKVERLGVSDRFYTPGHVDANVYGHIIDLWLQSFPVGTGESMSEYIYKEKSAVYFTLDNINWEDEKRKLGVLNYDFDLLATQYTHNIEDYIELSNKLIRDKNLRYYIGVANRMHIDNGVSIATKNACSVFGF